MVRTAVLKGKDPLKLLEEMEIIDQMGIHFIDNNEDDIPTQDSLYSPPI